LHPCRLAIQAAILVRLAAFNLRWLQFLSDWRRGLAARWSRYGNVSPSVTAFALSTSCCDQPHLLEPQKCPRGQEPQTCAVSEDVMC